MTANSVSRRQTLLAASAAIGSAACSLNVRTAHAKAPRASEQAPCFYRFNHGAMQATIVSDGPLRLGDPSAGFVGASREELAKMLTDNFLSTTNFMLEQNILVLNTGEKLIVFDTGMGSSTIFGPSTGKLLSTLRAANIDPKDVDAVVATHAHHDHVWGIMADDGSRNFPNAQIYISKADFDFWTDAAKLGMTDPP
jgi:glyoxylase-like metal-dependent hydrolase (beta-lactamase superfamily II)